MARSGSFRLVLARFGSFRMWLVLARFGSFWLDLDRVGSLRLISIKFGSFCFMLVHFGAFGIDGARSGSFWLISSRVGGCRAPRRPPTKAGGVPAKSGELNPEEVGDKLPTLLPDLPCWRPAERRGRARIRA